MSKPEMKPVESSNLKAVGHDGQNLFVDFHNGSSYKFLNVPSDIFSAIQQAGSAGKYFHAQIQGKFESEKLADADPAKDTDNAGSTQGQVQDSPDSPPPVINDAAGAAHPMQDAEFAEIKAVADTLNHGDDAHWNKDGEPDLNVLTEKLGRRVSREQVDVATEGLRRAPLTPAAAQDDAGNDQSSGDTQAEDTASDEGNAGAENTAGESAGQDAATDAANGGNAAGTDQSAA